MAERITAEHIADVKTSELSRVNTVLNEKSSKSSLNQTVLIPVRTAFYESSHGLMQRQGQLGLKTHDLLPCDGIRLLVTRAELCGMVDLFAP
jgi:hypothetical protein